jgi:PAS domain S-box-containing protein
VPLITGNSAKEVTGKKISLFSPNKSNDQKDLLAKFSKGGRMEHYETKRIKKDGAVIDVSLTISPIFDDEQNVTGFSSICRDITQRAQYSQYARSLIEASLDPLVTISADGKITDVNEASVKVTGVNREKLIGTDFSDYFTEAEKPREGYQQVFEKSFVADYLLTIRHNSGKLTDVFR